MPEACDPLKHPAVSDTYLAKLQSEPSVLEAKLAYRLISPTDSAEVMERIRRMASVLAAPLRIKIMAALSVRPMSPRMYQQEHGGGELSRIDDNFKELKRYGWIELVETKTGGRRRGATEHIYQLRQLPIFDFDVWAALPLPMREMVSWKIAETLVVQLGRAMEAGTMDAREDRHLTSTSGLVDQLGWERIVERVDGLFELFLEERKDSAGRLGESGEQSIPMMVVLAAFEAPRHRFEPDRPLAETSPRTPSMHALSLRMAKAMIDPLRLTILAELRTRAMSAKGFFEEFGGGEVTKRRVYRAFRALRDFDWIVLVEAKGGKERRPGKERFYRAARPPTLDAPMWSGLPESMKDAVSGKVVHTLVERLEEAIRAGTMVVRDDHHSTWTPGLVDQLGWDRVIGRTDDAFDFVRAEIARSEKRLDESGEQPIPITVNLAVFESPAVPTREH
jgi:DNA-binding transcriptional ArsR family regulator